MERESKPLSAMGQKLLRQARKAAADQEQIVEMSELRKQGTLAKAQQTIADLKNPQRQADALLYIKETQELYGSESSGARGEYLIKLAVLLEIEPHELLNPEDWDSLAEKIIDRVQ